MKGSENQNPFHRGAIASSRVQSRLLGIVMIGTVLAIPAVVTAATDAQRALEATDWQLADYRTDAGMQSATPAPNAALRFENGRLSGSVGCNRLVGGYEIDGDRLRFERTASTMMACPEPLMVQEQAAVVAFERAAGFAVSADNLTITAADGETLLRFNALEAVPLTGTEWQLTNYNNGKQAVVTLVKDSKIELQIAADGQFTGRACNTFRGAFEIDQDRITLVGGIAATRMFCAEPAGASEQETAFFAALEQVASYRIDGNTLNLSAADGATLALFKAK